MAETRSASKYRNPLAYPAFAWIVRILALAGLADAGYLSVSHYRVYTDIGYMSFCAISRAINCDTVSQSPYSIFLGVPVPVWGVFGYAGFFVFTFFAGREKEGRLRGWAVLFFLGALFSVTGVLLAAVSAIFIHSHCILCIGSHTVSLLLLYFTWLARNRYDGRKFFPALRDDLSRFAEGKKALAAALLPLCIAMAAAVAFIPPYWKLTIPDAMADIPTGTTPDGHPYIGAADPELTIVEFADYQCFQCQKMHFFLRRIVGRHPEKIRLVHRHFPMDNVINPVVQEQFHEGSARMAMLALYAAEKGRFWEMNDLLFSLARKKETIHIRELAEKTGVDFEGLSKATGDPGLYRKLYNDVRDGGLLGIIGTPAFVVNGEVYMGQLPADILSRYVR